MLAIRPVLRALISKNVGTIAPISRAYHDPNFRETTMNDLPVPQGDWQEAHDAKQRKYNVILILGIVTLVSTLSVVKQTGAIHLNYSPPKSYE